MTPSSRPYLPTDRRTARPGARRWLPPVVLVVVAGTLLVAGTVPWWLVAAYAAVSALTFGVYAADKRAAVHGRRRVPERTLHRLALLGGWPGAAVAQQLLRHKTVKPRFRTTYRWTVVVNVAVVAALVVAARSR